MSEFISNYIGSTGILKWSDNSSTSSVRPCDPLNTSNEIFNLLEENRQLMDANSHLKKRINEFETEANKPKTDPGYIVCSSITKVIFNGPATVVFWRDGSKTIVKCMDSDAFDIRTGLILCILKKRLTTKLYSYMNCFYVDGCHKSIYDYIMIQYLGGLKEYKEFLRKWVPPVYYKQLIDIWEPKERK